MFNWKDKEKRMSKAVTGDKAFIDKEERAAECGE
jgi:hypothetical protein